MFWGFFGQKSFFPLFHGGSRLRKLSKKSKKFQISKYAFNGFPKCPNVFWTNFGAMFLKFSLPSVPRSAFQIFWTQNKEFRFPKLKIWVQFADTIHNSHFFALPPESMYAIPFQIFWTENYEFRFPNLKILVQFSDTIINRQSFCIHATVNIRNPISDFLDLKLWVQIPQFKNKGLVFRT